MNILTLSDYFLPGSKAGGPIRTLDNMIQRLIEFSFLVVTRDRDLGDDQPYADYRAPRWYEVAGSRVRYLPPKSQGFSSLRSVLSENPYDVLYLNSFFSPKFTMIPLVLRRCGLIPWRPVVLAPRGEFSLGALQIKATKKKSYIALARRTGLYEDILWQASSEHEEEDIRRQFGAGAQVAIAPDVPPICEVHPLPPRKLPKQPGQLRTVFMSRINRKKNLIGAIKLLGGVKGDVSLDIYGPIEDREYWNECQAAIAALPQQVRVQYRGTLEHNQVVRVMSQYDLFLFPSLGENFGHVILEALLAGLPVLISDTTPWLGLAKQGIGWDLPLSQTEMYHRVLQEWTAATHEQFLELSRNARRYGENYCNDETVVSQNRALFERAVATTKARRSVA